jgi:hypothetical protein
MKSFDFKKSYEEIKINGEIYKVDLSDDKVKEYQKTFNKFFEESQVLQTIDSTKLSNEEQAELFDSSKRLVAETIDVLLGQNVFSLLYEQSGNSLINMIDLVTFLVDIIKNKTSELRDDVMDKYIKPKGKRK